MPSRLPMIAARNLGWWRGAGRAVVARPCNGVVRCNSGDGSGASGGGGDGDGSRNDSLPRPPSGRGRQSVAFDVLWLDKALSKQGGPRIPEATLKKVLRWCVFAQPTRNDYQHFIFINTSSTLHRLLVAHFCCWSVGTLKIISEHYSEIVVTLL